jgi:hypothetical protein
MPNGLCGTFRASKLRLLFSLTFGLHASARLPSCRLEPQNRMQSLKSDWTSSAYKREIVVVREVNRSPAKGTAAADHRQSGIREQLELMFANSVKLDLTFDCWRIRMRSSFRKPLTHVGLIAGTAFDCIKMTTPIPPTLLTPLQLSSIQGVAPTSVSPCHLRKGAFSSVM